MAASSPTVLAHVAWMLRGSFEDLAVEALGYILNSSETATKALEEVLRDGGRKVSSIQMVQTQAVEVSGELVSNDASIDVKRLFQVFGRASG